jgi:hypothetical protein
MCVCMYVCMVPFRCTNLCGTKFSVFELPIAANDTKLAFLVFLLQNIFDPSMYVCMYVYMYVYASISACIHVCMYVYAPVCIYELYVCIYTCIYDL